MPTNAPASVRLDVWLWSVRLCKTRSSATQGCRAGHVRLNGAPVKAAQPVRVGDRVSVKRPGWQQEFEVTRIAHTPIPGIFEVVSGVDVFYSDATGRYAFVDGRLVDTEKKMDLTQATLATLTTVDFKALPLDLAIKTVTGTGTVSYTHLDVYKRQGSTTP